MSSGVDISSAMMLAKPQPMKMPTGAVSSSTATKVSKQFESVFITEFLGSMFSGIPTDGPFGGGEGESMFRSLMLDEYGKQIENQGGFGLAAPVARQLLQYQETHA